MAGDPIFPPLTHTHTNTRWHPPHPFTPASFSISRSLNYRWNRRAKLLSRPRTITTRHRPPPIYLYSFPSRGERDRCLGSLNPSSFSPIENRGKKRVQAWRAIVNCRYVPPRRIPAVAEIPLASRRGNDGGSRSRYTPRLGASFSLWPTELFTLPRGHLESNEIPHFSSSARRNNTWNFFLHFSRSSSLFNDCFEYSYVSSVPFPAKFLNSRFHPREREKESEGRN